MISDGIWLCSHESYRSLRGRDLQCQLLSQKKSSQPAILSRSSTQRLRIHTRTPTSFLLSLQLSPRMTLTSPHIGTGSRSEAQGGRKPCHAPCQRERHEAASRRSNKIFRS